MVDIRTTMFAFPVDVLGEGADEAVGRMAAAGMSGISLAALYHDGRDVLPHNPRLRVKFQEDGVAFFAPDPSAFPKGGIRPIRSAQTERTGPFERTMDAARRHGVSVVAWAVFLHNTSLGRRNPGAVTRNVFGDPQVTSLCPANPETVAYSIGVATSLAGLGVDAVNAEGLHYLPFEHGYHHERYFLRIGPVDRLLFGLCFCDHCMSAAAARGVDTGTLRKQVRRRLEHVLESGESFDPADDTPEAVDTMWDGEVGAFLRSRESVVTDLARQVYDALRERSTTFIFNDPAGALRRPGAARADESWRLGINPVQLAGACDEVQMLAYSASAATVREDVAAYRRRIGPGLPLRVALRPMWPDCDSTENLTAKIEAVRMDGVVATDFYAYDFMRLEELDRVGSAVVASGWSEPSTPIHSTKESD